MAGSSMTFAYDEGVDGGGYRGVIKKIIIDWTSDDTTGAVTGTTRKIVGRLIKAVTDPGATAPTDNYDIAITDEESVNILTACQSTLANRHTSTTQEVYFFILDAAATPLAQSSHPVVCDTLTVAVTAAGNSKTGQIILYYEQ